LPVACHASLDVNRQASEDAPTSSEILQLASEQDGTRSATMADDQKREKDENWARFTEENAKGAGNTMNRFVSYSSLVLTFPSGSSAARSLLSVYDC
jgi:hypothetical protein